MSNEKTFEDVKAEISTIVENEEPVVTENETEEVADTNEEETDAMEVVSDSDDSAEDNSEDEAESEDGDSDVNSAVVPDELIERAVLAGISIKDARKYSDPEMLENIINLVSAKTGKGQKGIDSEEKHVSDIDMTILDSIPDLDPDEYDPEVVGAFSGVKQVVKALVDQVKQLQAENQNAVAQSTLSWIDSAFESLEPEYHEFLGNGPKDSLKPDGIEFKNRSLIVERMDILKAGYEAVNKPVPQNSELFKDALESIFGKKVVSKKINNKLDKRKNQHINRADKSKPTEKDVQKKDARSELVDTIASKIAEYKR